MDQAAPAHQEVSWQQRERSQDANLVRRVHISAHRHCLERTSIERLTILFDTDFVGLGIRENQGF
jgi:hypothetical protein